MITCVLTPYELAFENDNVNITIFIIDSSLNICFFLDIFINFLSAYYDSDYNMIDSHKVRNNISIII
jgi:hypothetical protein